MHPSRMAYVEEAEPEDTGIDLANVPLDNDYDMPSAGPGLAPERASAFQSQMDRRKKAAAIAVPTDDKRVRERLRQLGEPVTEFGEGPGDRRDRLRELLADLAKDDAGQDEEGDARMQDAGEGHIKPIYALDWGVDGHRVLSGSEDGWIKCWDVRKVQPSGGIGAHRMVSDLRWYKGMDDPARGFIPEVDEQGGRKPKKSGTFFVSSGFDKTVKIFSADDWSQVQSLTGHTGNVHSVDVTRDAKWIVSGGYDRTVKLWGRNDGQGL